MKNPNEPIGNRTRDLPACGTVAQPPALQRAPIKYYQGDKIKKNEMGGICGTYSRQEKCIQGFGGKTWWKETTWKDLGPQIGV